MTNSYETPLFTRGITLHTWQEDCVNAWWTAKRGTVKVVTGAGKTVLGLAIVERLWREHPDLRVAIVVPTIVLMNQWYDEIRQHTTLDMTRVGRSGGGKKDSFSSGARLLISVLNTASARLAEDATRAGVDQQLLLIVDECHRAGAAVMSHVFRTPRRFNLGLSATPERTVELIQSDGDPNDDSGGEWDADDGVDTQPYEQTVLGRELGAIVYVLSLSRAIDLGVLPPFEIRHFGLKLNAKEQAEYDSLSRSITDARNELEGVFAGKRRAAGGLVPFARSLANGRGRYAALASRFVNDSQRRKLLLYRAKARSDAVVQLLTSEFEENPRARAILFHESIAEVEQLAAVLRERLAFPVAAEHSKVPAKERAEHIDAFRRGDLRVLVSVRSLIEGFNVPAADVGIIIASSSSVRQRVQTLGRILRRHTAATGEEKHSVMHVLYVRDTVDESIYEREDWATSTGSERNLYFHLLPPELPLPQPAPPRHPLPTDADVDAEALQQGALYPGRYEGTEYTTDNQRNVKTLEGALVDAPAWLWQAVVDEKGQAGRFRVTPRRHFALVRVRGEADWATKFVGRLEGQLRPVKPAGDTAANEQRTAGSRYGGPVDAKGGEYFVRQRASGRHIARRRGADVDYAAETSSTKLLLKALDTLNASGIEVTHFRVNSSKDAIGSYAGSWIFLAHLEDDLEF